MEQLVVPQGQDSFLMFSVTVNQQVVEFEREALTGMVREEQVHLIWIIIMLSYGPRSRADNVHQPGTEKVEF